jgi:hypothetical protein
MDGDIRFLKPASCRRWSENIVWRFMNGCDMRPVLQLHPVKVHSRGWALALLRHQTGMEYVPNHPRRERPSRQSGGQRRAEVAAVWRVFDNGLRRPPRRCIEVEAVTAESDGLLRLLQEIDDELTDLQ